jgi:GT2 family glycosyltransferase/glycosyltransferase involved in cell wall biosynthesis
MEPADPRSLFDETWYRAHGPAFEGDAYEHFATIGWRRGRDPHPLFSVAHYLRQVPEPLTAGENPLEHYLRPGPATAYSPHVLFDAEFYAAKYGDSIGDHNPLLHYLRTGAHCGFAPNAFFDSAQYLKECPDVKASGMNPLVHYARSGGTEQARGPHPMFDAESYTRRRGLASGVNPLSDFLLRLHGARARGLEPDERPDVSVIILNLNKSLLTLQCVVEVLGTRGPLAIEVVVVDNGSRADDFAQLTRYLPAGVKLVRLSTNRYFGEGNNIGVEASNGRHLLFLNNDAFVGSTTIATLLDAVARNPDAGAAGPKFVYPDGRLQECGGFVSSCGTVTQRGKYLDDGPKRYARMEPVEYISAACLLIPRALFDDVGGFDLIWDPVYYEDVDLCLKLSLLGKRIYYCPAAVVTHVEKATSSDVSHGLRLDTIVQINREKFISRWGEYIERPYNPAAARVTLPVPRDDVPPQYSGTAVLYSPFPLDLGGGWRYLLTIAQQLSQRYHTYVVTPERYSSYRLRRVAESLGLDLSRVRLVPLAALARFADCDVFVAIGDEALPPHPPIGRRRIFVCRFPCPMRPSHVARAWEWLDGYDDVLVYSAFAARRFRAHAARVARRVPPVTILAPPSAVYEQDGRKRVPGRILNVATFARGANCKRQDTLVGAFRDLVRTSGRSDLELHLVGTVSADPASREFYLDVHRRARGLAVYFHINPLPEDVRELYASSSYYWHATGFGHSEVLFPERMEHFGLSVVEAMASGALPLVYAAGDVAETVADGVTGYHWRTVDELVRKTRELHDGPAGAAHEVRANGAAAARRYGVAPFEDAFARILGPSWATHLPMVPADAVLGAVTT